MFSLQIWIPASDGAGEASPVSQEAGHLMPPGQGLVTTDLTLDIVTPSSPHLISFPDRNKKIILDPDLSPVHWSPVTLSSE